MGANYSGIGSLKNNEHINRLVDVESISENDPFWNQLLSFKSNLTFTKENSKILDEGVSLECQKFHQNNPKSGNYGALIRVFCKLSSETQEMSDNNLMTTQTANALLLIRCFTKYLIEIENECALLEQINSKPNLTADLSCMHSNDDKQKLEEPCGWNELPDQTNDSQNQDKTSESLNSSPRKQRIFKRNESQDLTNEESESDSLANIQYRNQESKTLFQLINCLYEVCINIPVNEQTYYLHLEVLNMLIVLLSVQMYTKLPTHESFIYETIMVKMEAHVSDFIKALLTNIIQQMPMPQSLTTSETGSQRSLMSSVTSGLWSVMTLGYGSAGNHSPPYTKKSEIVTYLPNLSHDSNTASSVHDTTIDCTKRLLAWQSCHILLILSNHCTNESLYNPYRSGLFHFTDIQDTPSNISGADEPLPWFSIDYAKLYQMFTFTLHTDQYTLLLYMLLHRNQHFKMFILSRLNIDFLIIPIMKVIYTAPERNSHHIYMALIILLILSEDDLFNKTVHNIPIKKLTWYTERSLSEISLGGLLILVIIRTIQFNMTRMRDKYLHTNCLAALANMSSKFYNLHPYVCQRINSLFNLLAKKRIKIINSLNTEPAKEIDNEKQSQIDPQVEIDLVQDLSIIEELMKMVLEIINSCLTNHLHHNSDLIYSILYNKSLYSQFRSHPTFQEVIQNIDTIITSFSHEIENVEDKSIDNIKAIIEINANKFSRDRFRIFPELKFKYVEEDQPEEFFVPYVWSLVYKFSNLYWIDHTIKLFVSDLSTDTQS